MTIPEEIAARLQPESERECGNCGHASKHNFDVMILYCMSMEDGREFPCDCTEAHRLIADLLMERETLRKADEDYAAFQKRLERLTSGGLRS